MAELSRRALSKFWNHFPSLDPQLLELLAEVRDGFNSSDNSSEQLLSICASLAESEDTAVFVSSRLRPGAFGSSILLKTRNEIHQTRNELLNAPTTQSPNFRRSSHCNGISDQHKLLGSVSEHSCWGLVLKCYELRIRQHRNIKC